MLLLLLNDEVNYRTVAAGDDCHDAVISRTTVVDETDNPSKQHGCGGRK